MVIWIIGLSGSGKSTLGQSMVDLMKPRYPETAFIDGDIVREIMGNDLGHSIKDRWTNAQRISRLCQYLDSQNINVVCAILSIFHESQEWNRKNINNYKEIFLEASLDTLKRRDPRGLYAEASNGSRNDVVGIDIEFKPPTAPDLVINNDTDKNGMDSMAREALADLDIDVGTSYRFSGRNLLDSPEKYEYTEFQGHTFLHSYCDSRNTTIVALAGKVHRLENAYGGETGANHWGTKLGLTETANKFFFKELPITGECFVENEELVTRQYLIKMTDCAIGGDVIPDMDRLLRLVQRFEVTKVLYQKYRSADLRRTEAPVAGLLDLGLFATLLAILAGDAALERRLILLNSLMKVNDILESVSEMLCTPVEHYLALTALKKERELFLSIQNQVVA